MLRSGVRISYAPPDWHRYLLHSNGAYSLPLIDCKAVGSVRKAKPAPIPCKVNFRDAKAMVISMKATAYIMKGAFAMREQW